MTGSRDDLSDLVLLLARRGADGDGVRFSDVAAMHRALAEPVEACAAGWVTATLATLGYVPDAVYGRRIPSLDAAVSNLESEGLLAHAQARWVVTGAGRRRAAQLMLGLPAGALDVVDHLVATWQRHRMIAATLETEGRRTQTSEHAVTRNQLSR